MSARTLGWAWQQKTRTGTQKLVLAALADRADEDGYCYPSIEWLAVKCAPVAERSVRRAVDELAEQGLLAKIERRRRSDGTLGTWLYRLSVEGTSGHEWPVVQWPRVASSPVATSGRTIGSTRRTKPILPENVEADASTARKSRDAIWDALLVVCDGTPETREEKSRRGKCVKSILEAGGRSEDVPLRAAVYRRRWPGISLTDTALVAHWGECNGNGVNDRNYVCPVCGLRFKGKATLEDHLHVSHDQGGQNGKDDVPRAAREDAGVRA